MEMRLMWKPKARRVMVRIIEDAGSRPRDGEPRHGDHLADHDDRRRDDPVGDQVGG